MRRKGTSEQLAAVRNRGLALLEKGKKPKEVAEILNVTPSGSLGMKNAIIE